MMPWEEKAHTLIAKYAAIAWRKANTLRNGQLRRRHVPYQLPDIAHALVQALGIHDAPSREQEIKRLFEVEHAGAWSLI